MNETTSFPRSIHLEITTRCNLRCPMCIKYAPGCFIPENNMDMETFTALLPAIARADRLLLNGIGEPLMHDGLTEMIGSSRAQMNENGTIGFQSNGLLLSTDKIEQLLSAGLDTICLSVDSLHETETDAAREQRHREKLTEIISEINRIKKRVRPGFTIGIETVISRTNLDQLEELVEWAGKQETSYLIVSHLLPYPGTASEDGIFNPNSEEATRLFDSLRAQARQKNIDFSDPHRPFKHFNRSDQDQQLADLIAKAQKHASSEDIRLNFSSLLKHMDWPKKNIKETFDRAANRAKDYQMEIHLPPLYPPARSSCRFMEEDTAFVNVRGDVMPCHFLWHHAAYSMHGEEFKVSARPMGNVADKSLWDIWQKKSFSDFRDEAKEVLYPPCWNCAQGPCPSLLTEQTYGNDCCGSLIPCGHCPWSLGLFACL